MDSENTDSYSRESVFSDTPISIEMEASMNHSPDPEITDLGALSRPSQDHAMKQTVDTDSDDGDGTKTDQQPSGTTTEPTTTIKINDTSKLGVTPKSRMRSVRLAVNLSLAVNIVLLIAKIIIFALTFSYAVITSLFDSILDLLSQFIIWLTERKVRGKADHKYPVGKTRLEPVGILTVSVLMIVLSVIAILGSIQALVTLKHTVEWSVTGVILLGGTCL